MIPQPNAPEKIADHIASGKMSIDAKIKGVSL
jgi:hypothetical protein